MKITKIALVGTTALTLSMTAAMANDNTTFLTQQGTGNAALVTQSGKRNDAGAAIPTMTQQGFNNQLTILQSGNGNDIGLEGGGVTQDNPYNNGSLMRIDITQ